MLSALAAALACYGGAALLGIALGRRSLIAVYGLTCIGGAIAAVAAATFLAQEIPVEAVILPLGLPWVGAHFRVDALAAYFLLIVNTGAAIIGVFALEYGRHDAEPSRILPFYPVFIAAMNLVLIADDAFVFLVSWELMSLASWLLVLANHRQPGTSAAALLYVVMAAFGTGMLLLGFGLICSAAGSYAFADLRAAPLSVGRGLIFFTLALIGTGSKAGMVPLHVWLPPAHAAAPSHVSALMSGVMTKVALYGLIRLVFDLAGPPQWWWGAVVLLAGGVTALLGVLYAVMQHDLKRLLAYHTVENIGIILIGLGLALAFRADRLDALAALALSAALLHVANHASFKSLLFLGAGAVLVATGERDMERLGGLINRMKFTAFVFLIGAAAISALPPFNGFVSEWLTFQAIINGAELSQWLLKFAVPVVGAMLALAAALAAVCFVKVYGIVFLGRPRSIPAENAAEVGALMRWPMAVLAAICALIGVLPGILLAPLHLVTASVLPGEIPPLAEPGSIWLTPLGAQHSSYSGLVVLLAITLMTTLVAAILYRFASNRLRRGAAWDCGFPNSDPATQYTASSFAQPIRRIFGGIVFGARDKIDMPRPGETRAAHFETTIGDPIWQDLYLPILRLVNFLADRLNVTQFLTIRRYLSLMFAALVLLLLIVAVSQ